jgi:hypothetical protein
MKITRNTLVCLALILISVPTISAQDLSRYRNFSLGTSLAIVSKQVYATPAEVSVIHQSPAAIQELTWWAVESNQSSSRPEPVQQIRFSFYNRELYKIAVTYENAATEGLTTEDMIQSISLKYGSAIRTAVNSDTPANLSYSSAAIQLALWEDSQYSASLSRSPLSNSFQLVILSKQLGGQADSAIAEAVKQDREDAPRKEIARVKKVADDLETARQKNAQTFRP